MRSAVKRVRFLNVKEEGGFTLSEMMVTIMIMMIVFFALYSLFDTSVRIFTYGSNKVEAVESARLGLERMEREIRAAYPVDASDPDSPLFFSANGSTSNPPQAMPSEAQITVGNELGAPAGDPDAADGVITCGSPCEYITYKLSAPSNAPPCTGAPAGCSTLLRVNMANSNDPSDPGDPVSENAVVPGGLTFAYFDSSGNVIDPTIADPSDEANIVKVRVSLLITVDPGTRNAATQQLTTEIDLRNR